jgi:hypothetical protein
MWYLHTVEFYSAIKKNEILSFANWQMKYSPDETGEHCLKWS